MGKGKLAEPPTVFGPGQYDLILFLGGLFGPDQLALLVLLLSMVCADQVKADLVLGPGDQLKGIRAQIGRIAATGTNCP